MLKLLYALLLPFLSLYFLLLLHFYLQTLFGLHLALLVLLSHLCLEQYHVIEMLPLHFVVFVDGDGENSIGEERSKRERIELLRKHLELYEKNFVGMKPYEPMKRFFKIYIRGFEGAVELRERLMQTSSREEAEKILNET